MLNIISRFLFIFFIFLIVYPHPSTTMETERDKLQLNRRSNYPNSIYQRETIPNSPRAQGNEELDRTFSHLTRAKIQPTTPGQMLAGLLATFGIIPAVQVGLPLGMTGLDMLGVTSRILPVGSTESYYVLGAVALPPLLAATIWTYRSTIRVTQYLKPKVITAMTTTTERPYTWKEHLFFSYVTPAAQTLFGGGLLFAFIYDKESRLSG